MNEITLRNAQILAENAKNASRVFTLCGSLESAAFASAMSDVNYDIDRAKTCKKLVSSKTGLFSALGASATRIITTASVYKSNSPEKKIDNINAIYKIVKNKFWGNEYSALAAIIIEDSGKDAELVVDEMSKIYKLMKKEHFFYSSSEDSATYAIMALSGKSPEELTAEAQNCYKILKPNFFDHNDLLTLCSLLAIYDEACDLKCSKVLAIVDELKKRKLKLSGYSSVAILAPLVKASMEKDASELATEIAEVEKYLSSCKVFGGLSGVGKSLRTMFACGVVSNSIGNQAESITNVVTASVTAIVTQEVVMAACICACIASSTAAATSNT